MSEEKDDIGEILSDFKDQKNKNNQIPIEPLEPPKRRTEDYIDFAKADDDEEESGKPSRRIRNSKQKKSPEETEAIKAKRAAKRNAQRKKANAVLTKIRKAICSKKVIIALISIIAVILIVFGIKYAVKQAEGAYLKPYEEKYPDAQFEIGMLEKYCDILGKNPDTVGYIEIPEIELKANVSSNAENYPYAEECTEGASQFNYVVYLNDNSLEKFYSSATAYNNSSGYITYSDLFNDYNFKVVGVFYTNTRAQDDDGYIFPYNVTEKMTVNSAKSYVSALESRFIYSTGVNITRQDTLLTISCPTHRKNFRFVVIGVMREDTDSKPTATEKSNVYYPQVIYDERKIDKPYIAAPKWYPEIIITDSEGNEKIIKKTLEDYE